MGLETLNTTRAGTPVPEPVTRDDWRDWVSAGKTRNHIMDDPLLDWLALYGRDNDYLRKAEMETYREELDFVQFIFAQGHAFEEGILKLLQQEWDVRQVAVTHHDIADVEAARETFAVMQAGAPIIYQGVLWDADTRTFGSPDFMFRADVLRRMFPEWISPGDSIRAAPDLGGDWHYRVVDTKFANLHFNASGTELGNGGSLAAYKAQVHIYNNILGRLQGYEPDRSYLLGRGWEQRTRGKTERGHSAFDRLGPVLQDGNIANRVSIRDAVQNAVDWIRRLRTEGADWSVLPVPSVPELYPNAVNHDDGGLVTDVAQHDPDPFGEDDDTHWVGVKKWLAGELKELTMLWGVGVAGRRRAHEAGIYRWDHEGIRPGDVGVGGNIKAPTLERMLRINTGHQGYPVMPERVSAGEKEWREPAPLEFFVDFEFCSDLNDDFSALPEKGGQPLIFMIGCGHMEDGEWRFKSLVADRLTEAEELRIIREWFDHMEAEAVRCGVKLEEVPVVHWSKAEIVSLETAYNSARVRHGSNADWPERMRWYDFLHEVMLGEPVVIKGAMGFGLKAVAKSLHAHGFIETNWADSEVDGLGAMVGAWRCQQQAADAGISLMETEMMPEIARYNEVDCKVMMEIVEYLRRRH